MGIFDEHDPLSMHMLGMHGSKPQRHPMEIHEFLWSSLEIWWFVLFRAAYANFAIQNSDCIIAVGGDLHWDGTDIELQ